MNIPTATAELLRKCVIEAFAGKMTFPETIQNMASVGVRWYSANLLFGIKTHYFEGGETHQEKWPSWKPITAFRPFDQAEVVAAIRSIQKREIIYPEFLHQIADAGIVVYTVHLQGRKAIYLGADGDFHVELFPKAA
jgi:uncharacterized protein YbcV (DUF1398 family)